MEELQAVGVAAGAMLRVSELPGFEYYIERRFFRQAVHPHMPDPFTVEAAPMWSDRLPDPPAQPAPMMGEHTTQVLREWLNMDDTAISALVAEKVLEQWVG
jgi:crotonobetainyl-CoA:carnitine CoA-transferase CaiB-like acyl-CoA transferase